MSVAEKLILTESELALCRPIRSHGGRCLRAFCPYHGSDHQRSLQVNLETGRVTCFGCGAWGYTEESRARWLADRKSEREADHLRRRQPTAPRRSAPST